MIKSALYIYLLLLFWFSSCSGSNSNKEETDNNIQTPTSQVSSDTISDTLSSGKGTESSSSNQPGLGTSENGLSTDVVIDSTTSDTRK